MIVDAGMATVVVAGTITGVVVTMTVAITGEATAGNPPQKSGALSAAFFVPVFCVGVDRTIS